MADAAYKLYAKSFTGTGRDHLQRIQEEAQAIIQRGLHGGRGQPE